MKFLYILISAMMISCTGGSSGEANNVKKNTMEIYKAELELEIPASLGEGAIWNHQTNTFWWVDIEGRKLNIYDPEMKSNREIDVKDSQLLRCTCIFSNGLCVLNLEWRNRRIQRHFENPIW